MCESWILTYLHVLRSPESNAIVFKWTSVCVCMYVHSEVFFCSIISRTRNDIDVGPIAFDVQLRNLELIRFSGLVDYVFSKIGRVNFFCSIETLTKMVNKVNLIILSAGKLFVWTFRVALRSLILFHWIRFKKWVFDIKN